MEDKFFNKRFICENCGGLHKTSRCPKARKDVDGLPIVCHFCTGPHQSSEHDRVEALKNKQDYSK